MDAGAPPLDADEDRADDPKRDLHQERDAECFEPVGVGSPRTLQIENQADREDREERGEETSCVGDPVAVLKRCDGLCVRAWSNAIIEAGPPIAKAISRITSSQIGAGPGHRMTVVQAASWKPTAGSTRARERRCGARRESSPSTGPKAIPAKT